MLEEMTYPGGKNGAGVYQTIINLMPPHEVYIEPFLGSGAVMRLKRPALLNIGVDLVAASELPMKAFSAGNADEDLHGKNSDWRRHRTPEMAMVATRSVNDDRARHHHPLEMAIPAEIIRNNEGARIILEQSSNSAIPPVLSPLSAMADPPAAFPTMGPTFEFHQSDGVSFLKRFRFRGNEFVYCDPPYLMETRSGRRLYEFEMPAIAHRRLLRVIRKLPCMAMISGYWSEMYANALAGWNVETYNAVTRGGTVKTEYLWFNFPRPTGLHDYRYLGQGFRERERIKRKKARWTARLKRLPTLERQALLSAIADIAF
jgi:hypothetical protein